MLDAHQANISSFFVRKLRVDAVRKTRIVQH